MNAKTYDLIYKIAEEARNEADEEYCKPRLHCKQYAEILVSKLSEHGFDPILVRGNYKIDKRYYNVEDEEYYTEMDHYWVEIIDCAVEEITRIDISSDQFNDYLLEPNGKVMIIEDDDWELKERYLE